MIGGSFYDFLELSEFFFDIWEPRLLIADDSQLGLSQDSCQFRRDSHAGSAMSYSLSGENEEVVLLSVDKGGRDKAKGNALNIIIYN